MKISGSGVELSSGRTFYCNRGIIGISDECITEVPLLSVFEGYDGSIDIDEWTDEEKLELMDYAIGLWEIIRSELTDLPTDIAHAQWLKFSEIQHATYLAIDDESVARCRKWIETGDDEDAWS